MALSISTGTAPMEMIGSMTGAGACADKITSSPSAILSARKDRQMASVPHATPTACLTPQYSANSFSNACRLAPLRSRMVESTWSQRWHRSPSMERNFRVRSSSGIFIAGALVDTIDLTPALAMRLPVPFLAAGIPSTVSMDCSDNALLPFPLRQAVCGAMLLAKPAANPNVNLLNKITLTREKADRIRNIAGACPKDYKIVRYVLALRRSGIYRKKYCEDRALPGRTLHFDAPVVSADDGAY